MPPQEPSPPLGAGSGPALRDQFSLQAGAACSRFYAEVVPPQVELRRLRGELRRPQARERAKRLVGKIQSGSRGFLRRLQAIPLPSSSRRRQDASRLLASTEAFVGVQGENLDLVSGVLDEPRRVSRAERASLPELQARLVAELREQQALVRRLDIPECLPS